MKNLLLLTAASVVMLASSASAAVSYTYGGDGGAFNYVSPDYIDASISVPASALTACSSFSTAACDHVLFSFPDDNASVAAVIVYVDAGSGTGTIFARTDFGEDGVHTGLYSPSRTLTVATLPDVSAAPEPASWALMIVGLGMIGFSMRRHGQQDVRSA